MNRMPNRTVLLALATAALFAAAGCTTDGNPGSDDLLSADPVARGEAKRKAGPSLTYEDQRELGSNSLLAETERLREELARAGERLTQQDDELRTKASEAIRLTGEIASVTRERDDLKRLLDESSAKERGLTEQAAAAEIERLRMERQLVELKLASLVREGK